MESIPAIYFVFVYAVVALPCILAFVSLVMLLIVAVLYFTHRRKAAAKIAKIFLSVAIVLVACIALTRPAIGL